LNHEPPRELASTEQELREKERRGTQNREVDVHETAAREQHARSEPMTCREGEGCAEQASAAQRRRLELTVEDVGEQRPPRLGGEEQGEQEQEGRERAAPHELSAEQVECEPGRGHR